MTIQEIADQAYTLSTLPIDLLKARRFISEAMEILALKYDTACIKDTITINCTDTSVLYDLPSDCIGVTKATFKAIDSNVKYNDYLADGGTIQFNDIGTYTVTYQKTPKLIERKKYDRQLGSDSPPINASYHRVLPCYIAAQALITNNPADARASKYLTDFENLSKDAHDKLNRLKRKGARIAAPLWR